MVQTVSKYRVENIIGEGGMGKVFLGSFTDNPLQKVAIKELSAEQATDPELRMRFQREAEILATLDHPNIVKFHDFKFHNGLFYLVMEFVKGRSLSEYVLSNRHNVDPHEAIMIFNQILDALQYAHGKKVVHRDIKPSNIMITPEGSVKILDFGIARITNHTHAQTTFGTILGTPMYMSPEQIKGFTADHRSDIYSLGVLLHFILTKSSPYDAEHLSEYDIKTHVIRDPLPRLHHLDSTLPPDFQGVVDKATDKNMVKRYQSCSEFKEHLNRTQNHTDMETLVVGRDHSCDIVINDSSISRRHAEISVVNEQYLYRDMSSNGSFIGGKNLIGRQEVVYPGTEIMLAGKIPLPWGKVLAMLPIRQPVHAGGGYNNGKTSLVNIEKNEPAPAPAPSPAPRSFPIHVPRPSNYKIAAILVALFCGILWGAIAYAYASQVNDLYDSGEYQKAEQYSNNAKIWCVVGVVFQVVLIAMFL